MCERQSRNVSRSVCSAIYTHTEKCVRLTFSRQREPNFVLIPPPPSLTIYCWNEMTIKNYSNWRRVYIRRNSECLCASCLYILRVMICCNPAAEYFFSLLPLYFSMHAIFSQSIFFIRKEKHRNKRNETLLRMINAQNAFLHHCEPSCCSLPPFTLSPVFDCFFFHLFCVLRR